MVAHLFERFGSNSSQLLIFGLLQGLPDQHHQSAVEEVAHDGGAIVHIRLGITHQGAAVRQFQQGVVAKIGDIAEVGQLVFGGIATQGHSGLLVQQTSLTNQIKADVGQRNVFFDHGAVATPFGVALAQHHGIVCQVQQVVGGCAHDYMCPTSSGIS